MREMEGRIAGQGESLIVTNTTGGKTATISYIVGYNDLQSLSDPAYSQPYWKLIGGNTTSHGSNLYDHWMTAATYSALKTATVAYLSARGQVCTICVNDSALPFGGKFDICATSACTKKVNGQNVTQLWTWDSPHAEHDRGTAVDIAVSTSQCPTPIDPVAFVAACKAAGFNPAHTFPEPLGSKTPNHVHCNLADPSTYVH
jgi:hypothetical protein